MTKVSYKEIIKKNKGNENIQNKEENKNNNTVLNFLKGMGKRIDYPVVVNSGCRCEKVNAVVGGVVNSHHRLGYAADLTCKDVEGLKDHLKKYIG